MLRGASFAFRKTVLRTAQQRRFGAVFAVSSVIVPFAMGAIAGAIASGRVPAGGKAGDPWSSWVNPTSVLGGVLAVVVAAYLSAVYLTFDAARLEHGDLVDYFRRRAVGAAVVAGRRPGRGGVRAPRRRRLRVRRPDLPGPAAGRGLRRVRGRARWSCSCASPIGAPVFWPPAAVATVVASWGVAQWDYLLPTSLTVADGAAPDGTLAAVLVATGLAVLFIFPSMALLYRLGQKGLLPDEGVEVEA